MATIGLIHGAWHGAWCWDRLTPELVRRGHRVVAVDLPAEDASVGLRRYAELTAEALGDADDVVLVGHSLGGAAIPLVAMLRPVAHLVFLCALLPVPGKSATDRYNDDPDTFVPGYVGNTATRDDGASYWPDANAAARVFYHDCSAEDTAWALVRLRAQSAAPRGRSTRFPTSSGRRFSVAMSA